MHFFSLDRSEPPHIYVVYGTKTARYWLVPVELARSEGFRAHELNRVRTLIIEHRILFQEAWDELSTARAVRINPDPAAVEIDVSDTMLRIVLTDGRELAAPLAWFPRLRDATPEQRRHWELIGRGHGIHWPDVDEDASVRVLLGQPS